MEEEKKEETPVEVMQEEEPKKVNYVLFTLVLIIIFVIIAVFGFFITDKDMKPSESKEDSKIEEKKEEKKEEVVTPSSTETDYRKKYDELRDSKVTYNLEDIKGTDEEIVSKSFQLISSHYNHGYKDQTEKNPDLYSNCFFLAAYSPSIFFEKMATNCLANVTYEDVTPVGSPSISKYRLTDEEGYKKVLSINPNSDAEKFSNICKEKNFTNEECNQDKYSIYAVGDGYGDNMVAVDVDSISKKDDIFYVKLNEYTDKGEEVAKETIEIKVKVQDGHIVFVK